MTAVSGGSTPSIGSRFGKMFHRLVMRVEHIFDQTWVIIPSQPILNSFIFFGTLLVILVDAPPIYFEGLMIGHWVFIAWCAMGIASPIGTAIAHHLIYRYQKRTRLFGFWLRAGSDIMTLLALTAYIVARFLSPFDDASVYSISILIGVWVIQTLLVVRDLWALVLIERTASRLHKVVYEGGVL